jgi:hypothetical protein
MGPSQVTPTYVAPTMTGSTTAPSSSQSVKSSATHNMNAATGFMCSVLILSLAITQL